MTAPRLSFIARKLYELAEDYAMIARTRRRTDARLHIGHGTAAAGRLEENKRQRKLDDAAYAAQRETMKVRRLYRVSDARRVPEPMADAYCCDTGKPWYTCSSCNRTRPGAVRVVLDASSSAVVCPGCAKRLAARLLSATWPEFVDPPDPLVSGVGEDWDASKGSP